MQELALLSNSQAHSREQAEVRPGRPRPSSRLTDFHASVDRAARHG